MNNFLHSLRLSHFNLYQWKLLYASGMGSTIDTWEPLISGLHLPWGNRSHSSRLAGGKSCVWSPSPPPHLPCFSQLGPPSYSQPFNGLGLSKVTGDFLMTQWSEHLSDIFLHLTGTGNLIIPVILFFFFCSIIKCYPQRFRFCFFSLFTHNWTRQDFSYRILIIRRLIDVLYGKCWKKTFFFPMW